MVDDDDGADEDDDNDDNDDDYGGATRLKFIGKKHIRIHLCMDVWMDVFIHLGNAIATAIKDSVSCTFVIIKILCLVVVIAATATAVSLAPANRSAINSFSVEVMLMRSGGMGGV
ncbi:hypothetical protein GQX74_006380 [Glossina fuscipes]|nr:hypothetical protein GQX74_006380 [Glossina fuscipes]